MKQTAVEWLVQEINKINVSTEARIFINKLENQAKEMEKEQIMDARINGDMNGMCIAKLAKEKAEKYYNETFKSE
jgi:hypothetical protein